MFCRISQNCAIAFSPKLFVRTGWTSSFVLKQTKRGVSYEIWHLWLAWNWGRRRQAPHDSDHAECSKMSIFRQQTNFEPIVSFFTHSPRSITTILAIGCPRFTQLFQEFDQFGPVLSLPENNKFRDPQPLIGNINSYKALYIDINRHFIFVFFNPNHFTGFSLNFTSLKKIIW